MIEALEAQLGLRADWEKIARATQYAIGNPLLAIQMIEHTPQHVSHTSEERPTGTVQKRSYTEHRILRGASAIYARHYAGTGPALVLMHGFPDNLHIYDRLIPYLRDRQGITFDFLGWGASDKPTDYPYTSKQQASDVSKMTCGPALRSTTCLLSSRCATRGIRADFW